MLCPFVTFFFRQGSVNKLVDNLFHFIICIISEYYILYTQFIPEGFLKSQYFAYFQMQTKYPMK